VTVTRSNNEPGILDRIVTSRRESLIYAKEQVPLAQVRTLAESAAPVRSLDAAIRSKTTVALIAEMKRSSASAGELDPDLNPAERAYTYAENGAAAISILTEPHYFKGGMSDVEAARQATETFGVPILQKDFVIDEYQLFEGRAHGADAVLLIMGILSRASYNHLFSLARSLGMDPLVEVFNLGELEEALILAPRLIGINNRNLDSLEVSLEVFEQLATEIPSGTTLVAESGIKSVEDVRRMARAGANAVLVGESLMRTQKGLPGYISSLSNS
jgi:indole-3-glycerol phosphate synthase